MESTEQRSMEAKKIIAIIGTGRSGTHLLGYLLNTADSTTASIEDDELFPRITNAAIKGYESSDIAHIEAALRRRLDECPTRFYIEKSHPLLWLASLPNIRELPIRFVGIRRDPYEVVASMLEHSGTRAWCEKWQRLPQPNIFLGISQSNAKEYEKMTLAQRCTIRWVSHMRELDRLTYILDKNQLLIVDFNQLIFDKKKAIDDLETFTEMRGIDRNFAINADTRDKWKGRLTPAQVREVAATLSCYGIRSDYRVC